MPEFPVTRIAGLLRDLIISAMMAWFLHALLSGSTNPRLWAAITQQTYLLNLLLLLLAMRSRCAVSAKTRTAGRRSRCIF